MTHTSWEWDWQFLLLLYILFYNFGSYNRFNDWVAFILWVLIYIVIIYAINLWCSVGAKNMLSHTGGDNA